MRIANLVALVATFLLLPADSGHAQADDLQGAILFAPNAARTVTVTRRGALLASLQIPQGTLMVASYDEQNPTSFTAGRREFHGDFRLYALPATENTPPPVPGGKIDQIRNEAPLVLSVQDVDVLMAGGDAQISPNNQARLVWP